MSHLASLGLPSPRYLHFVARRSMLTWLWLRMTYATVLFAGALAFGLLPMPDAISAAVFPGRTLRTLLVTLGAFLVWVDRKRSHELLLHANLGASEIWIWTVSLLAAGVADVAIQTLLRLFL